MNFENRPIFDENHEIITKLVAYFFGPLSIPACC